MLKINFDVSGLSGNSLTGIATYSTNLIKALQSESSLDISGSYRISRLKNRKNIAHNSNLKNIFPLLPIFNPKIDIFHGPDFWVPSFGRFKKVVTIHDLTFYQEGLYDVKFAAYFQKRLENMLLKAKPDHIIVDSDFIKNEFSERFPAFRDEVSTVYLGADHFEEILPTKPLYDFPYITTIGMISKRKNIEKLCCAFDIISKKNKDLKLIICGGLGSEGILIKETILKLNLTKNIIFTGYVTNESAQNIIQNAQFLVFPSLYEGFGIPILEAMAMKVPVLTSNFGAMKEISGDAAFFSDSTNIDSLYEAMNELLNNQNLKNSLIKKGENRFLEFTWKKCAYNTSLVYKKV